MSDNMMMQNAYGAPSLPTMPGGMPGSVTNSMAVSREAQEVQAMVFMAKQFPRDENQSIARIRQSCSRFGLASKAIYSYPKGGTNVTGPSIRLAEAIAQSWGNIQSSAVELEQRPGESTCMTYCWDIETNSRDVKVFTVPHQIQTRNGTKVLTDPRDIYEHVANQMARRKRSCILAVIPKDVVDMAVAACCETLEKGDGTPLIDKLRDLVARFQKYQSVPLEAIERYFGYKLDAFTAMDGATLQGIYNSLKEGSAKREDYFKLPKAAEPAALPETGKAAKDEQPTPPAPPAPPAAPAAAAQDPQPQARPRSVNFDEL